MSSETSIIEMRNVGKVFNAKLRKGFFKKEKTEVKALQNLNLQVKKGEIFTLLGPNGAGKTTAIKILTTLLLPTSGEVYVNGFDINENSDKIRGTINAMLMGERSIYWKLTGRQNLQFFGALYYQSDNDVQTRIEELSSLLDIGEFLDRPVESYSSGQKFKLAFAKTLINDPPLIFLDEPTATLDPRAARTMREIIKKINKEKGTTIFLTTHNMIEATELSDRVAIIDLGEIIAMDTPDNLRYELSKTKHNSVNVIVDTYEENLVESLKQIEGVLEIGSKPLKDSLNQQLVIITKENQHIYEIVDIFKKFKINIIDLKTETPTLEEVFLERTGRTLEEDTSKTIGGD